MISLSLNNTVFIVLTTQLQLQFPVNLTSVVLFGFVILHVHRASTLQTRHAMSSICDIYRKRREERLWMMKIATHRERNLGEFL
jgi:hypothetical protein